MQLIQFRQISPKDLGDIAAKDIGKNTLEALETQEINRLYQIEAALSRIKDNHYGVCISCGCKIPRERLEAIPYSLRCIQCKTSEERKNR